MSGWDDEDFEPPEPTGPTDKWEGEDSDDDNIKAAWDQDSEEEDSSKKDDSESQVKAVQVKKKKKTLAEKIAEKEALKAADLEAEAEKEAQLEKLKTPEGKLEEKIRLQKMEEHANLELAKDMLGLKVSGGIDSMMPETKDQFDEFEKAVGDKIHTLASSEHFNDFAEKLIKRICLDLNVATLKKVKMLAESLHSAKLKEEKAAKSKKPAAKARTTVKMDLDKDLYSGTLGGDFDDMDDFM